MNKISAEELFKIAYKNFEKKNFKKSIELFEKLVTVYPENLSILRNLAQAYAFSGKLESAEMTVKKIININENEPFAYQFLATLLKDQDKIDEMQKLVDKAIEKKLINNKWKIQKELVFPKIPKNKSEINIFREKISKKLSEILNEDFQERLNYDDDEVITPPHFELSYNDHNNLELNKKNVLAIKKLFNLKDINQDYSKEIHGKIKIGIISEFLTDHTIGRLYKNLILSLDTNKFDISIFHSKKTRPGKIFNEFKNFEEKKKIKNLSLPVKLSEKIEKIKNENFDVLFYPDIGMSIEFYYLSLIRLAKYQLMTFGHPETTGSKSIDHYLISKKVINQNTQKYFSENLLVMETMPMIFEKPIEAPTLSKSELSKRNIYSCPQSLFKIHPDFDEIIFKIQNLDPKSEIYLIKDKGNIYYKKLLERFRNNKNFVEKKIHFFDSMNLKEYLRNLGKSSVLLDPLYYGAGNSFFESMVYGTPTITLPTDHIKSRLVLGAYKQMEVSDAPIANSVDEYIKLAIEYANSNKLFEIKERYRKAAESKLFNTRQAGVEFNQLILNLFKKAN